MGDLRPNKNESIVDNWDVEDEDKVPISRWEEGQDGQRDEYISRWNRDDEADGERWGNEEQSYCAEKWGDTQEYGYGQLNYGNDGHWSQNRDNFDDIQAEHERHDEEMPLYFLAQLKLDFESMFNGNKKFHSAPKDKMFTK